MTRAEALQWVQYVTKRGPLNSSRHLERGFALLASMLCTGHKITIGGKKPNQEFFMPFSFPKAAADVESTVEDVFRLFKGLAKNGK